MMEAGVQGRVESPPPAYETLFAATGPFSRTRHQSAPQFGLSQRPARERIPSIPHGHVEYSCEHAWDPLTLPDRPIPRVPPRFSRQRSYSEPPPYTEVHPRPSICTTVTEPSISSRSESISTVEAATVATPPRRVRWKDKSVKRKILEGGLAAAWIPFFPIMFVIEFLVREPPQSPEDYYEDPALALWYTAVQKAGQAR